MQAGLRGDGGSDTNAAADMRTIKALLLNGAVKPADWTNSLLAAGRALRRGRVERFQFLRTTCRRQTRLHRFDQRSHRRRASADRRDRHHSAC